MITKAKIDKPFAHPFLLILYLLHQTSITQSEFLTNSCVVFPHGYVSLVGTSCQRFSRVNPHYRCRCRTPRWRPGTGPLEGDERLNREHVVHGDGEHVDDTVYVNTWLSPHRDISKDRIIQYFGTFQLRRKFYDKPGREALKHTLKATL